jgi:glutaredoxin
MLTKIGKENENLEIDLNHKTFPIIFLNKKFLGGYNELVNLS